jgi:membrane-associated phospholipid phosphatase
MKYDHRVAMKLLSHLLLIIACKINAQDTLQLNSENPDPLFTEQRTNKNGWIIPVAVAIGYSAGTYICYRFGDSEIQERSQEHQTKFKSFIADAVNPLGLGAVQTIGLAGTSLFAFTLGSKKLQKTCIIWAGSLLINSIITDQLKKTFQRHRPSSGSPYNSFDWRNGPDTNSSFPSAHTSNAFTTATVFSTMYKNSKWVAPVAYSLASLVGLSRIYHNAHWASDVLAGAAIDFLSAKGMNSLYNLTSKKITFLPQVSSDYYSVSMLYQF